MVKGLFARSRRIAAGAALAAAVLAATLAPKPAAAWWGPGWSWRGGVVVGFPPVVVGAPIYAPAPYPYYAPAYAYAPPYWHWVPEHREAKGAVVPGHWEP